MPRFRNMPQTIFSLTNGGLGCRGRNQVENQTALTAKMDRQEAQALFFKGPIQGRLKQTLYKTLI